MLYATYMTTGDPLVTVVSLTSMVATFEVLNTPEPITASEVSQLPDVVPVSSNIFTRETSL